MNLTTLFSGLFGGAVLVFIFGFFRERWMRPILDVTFGEHSGCYVQGSPPHRFLRLRVMNVGKTVARNCQAIIVRIDTPTPCEEDIVELNWSWSSVLRAIPAGAEFFVDIIAYNDETRRLEPEWATRPPLAVNSIAQYGHFRFLIRLCADNANVLDTSLSFDFAPDGLKPNWQRRVARSRTEILFGRVCGSDEWVRARLQQ
jgi:hypothetical protein